MSTSAHVSERAEVRREREHVQPAVARDEVPLVARGEHGRAGCRTRALTAWAEDACIDVGQRRRQSVEIVLRRRDRHVAILRQALRAVRLDGDPSDRDVLDAMTCERLEQLARMEHVAVAHRSAVVRRLTAARPTRSSEATVFQFNASSSRPAIGRRRASITASGTTSGSRTAPASVVSTERGCSADGPTRANHVVAPPIAV